MLARALTFLLVWSPLTEHRNIRSLCARSHGAIPHISHVDSNMPCLRRGLAVGIVCSARDLRSFLGGPRTRGRDESSAPQLRRRTLGNAYGANSRHIRDHAIRCFLANFYRAMTLAGWGLPYYSFLPYLYVDMCFVPEYAEPAHGCSPFVFSD